MKKAKPKRDDLEELKERSIEFRQGNHICLIPTKGGSCALDLQGCHTISKPHLSELANKDKEVLSWPATPYEPGLQFVKFKHNRFTKGIPPVPMGIDTDLVKVWSACQPHDDHTFAPIEKGATLNPNSQEQNFLLAFRSVVNTAAFYEGVSTTLCKTIAQKLTVNAKEARRQIGKLPKVFDTKSKVMSRLQDWQDSYNKGYTSKLQHAYEEVDLPIRLAGTYFNITDNPEEQHPVITFLPDKRSGKTIILAADLTANTQAQGPTPSKTVTNLRNNLSTYPLVEVLGGLIYDYLFLYISPDDWKDTLNEHEQIAIQKMMLKKYLDHMYR